MCNAPTALLSLYTLRRGVFFWCCGSFHLEKILNLNRNPLFALSATFTIFPPQFAPCGGKLYSLFMMTNLITRVSSVVCGLSERLVCVLRNRLDYCGIARSTQIFSDTSFLLCTDTVSTSLRSAASSYYCSSWNNTSVNNQKPKSKVFRESVFVCVSVLPFKTPFFKKAYQLVAVCSVLIS